MTNHSTKSFHEKIVQDTAISGYSLVSQQQANKLGSAALVEVGNKVGDQIMVRPLDSMYNGLGIAVPEGIASTVSTVAESAPEAETNESEAEATLIDDDVPLMPSARGGARVGAPRKSKYAFDKLLPGQSFLVRATAAVPDPAKTLASTVSAATRRYSVLDPSGATRKNAKGEVIPKRLATRQFTIQAVKAGQTYPGSSFVEPADGARIYRIDGTPNARKGASAEVDSE